MSRGQGHVYRPTYRRSWDSTHKHSKHCSEEKGCLVESKTWWLQYWVRGKAHRDSSETTVKQDAQRKLRQKIEARESGTVIGRPDRVTLADLQALTEKQYDLDGRRSKGRLQQYWKHLCGTAKGPEDTAGYFDPTLCAVDITAVHVDDYAAARLKAGASRQTVNNELSALRRGFRLAIKKKLLAVMPPIELPKVANARSGFFEEGEFAAVLLELPDEVRDLVTFLRATGWRRDEARLLTWPAVDKEGSTLRLKGAGTKSGKPRVFPFALAPALKELLDARWSVRDGAYVFHRAGQPLTPGAVRFAWARATKRAGVPGRLVHDLRRTAARDFRRAGISEGVIMALCGWKTRSMFDRYNIIDEQDLAAAVAKRYGKRAASNDASPADAARLSSGAA